MMCANHEHHLGACENLTAEGGPGRVCNNVYTKASEQEESSVISGCDKCPVIAQDKSSSLFPSKGEEEWSQAVDTESQGFETVTGVSIEDFTGNSCR